MIQHISADALDDEAQFQLNPDRKRGFPSGSDISDTDEQRVVASKKKKKNRQRDRQAAQPHEVEAGMSVAQDSVETPKNGSQSEKQKVIKSRNKSHQLTLKTTSKDVSQPQKKLAKKPKKDSTKNLKVPVLAEFGPLASTPGEETSIGLQPPDLQLSYLTDRQKRALSKLSDLELEPLRFHQSWLLDVSGKSQRANLGSWLHTGSIPDLLEAIKTPTTVPGSPAILVIASAALRAVDLCRQVKPLLPSPKITGGVAKLFARHFKLQEHITHLNSALVAIGVGTPNRISKLIESKALKLDRLRWLLLDTTWLDAKSYSLPDLPEAAVRQALWQGILGNSDLLAMLREGDMKLVLF
ncbi:hypothetical protein CROQUDRAFT_656233 [Cronartium quercuum f. sp. fusiforme G11]|uniref:Uncharacterized protein n=1 Tax=Cronartium quercuum f. sp. fusiforme G11 TaxID=708437 RepID=A0A9P6TD42_9BASI|nr:hypothetical protein CROQUDRAFT_656233 [Cronartium quercuum f. sp. fusiforme G11]